ncbi:MAG: hypothetical protein AB1942_12585 [Pseudomonadota bacterium]
MRPNLNSNTQHRGHGLPEDLAALIEAEIYAGPTHPIHPTQFHCELQARLQVLGERLGYMSKAEYWSRTILGGRPGLIDVVWTSPDGSRGVAIELDASWRRKSITKLLHMAPTHHPVWIVYGDPYMTFGRDEYDLDRLIIIEPDLARLPTFCRARPGRERLEAYRAQQRAMKAERQLSADRTATSAAPSNQVTEERGA